LDQRSFQLRHTREQLLDQRFKRPRNRHTKIITGASNDPARGQPSEPHPTAEQLQDRQLLLHVFKRLLMQFDRRDLLRKLE
jgi:hypothetical protein